MTAVKARQEKDARWRQLESWLADTLGLTAVSAVPVSGDASFRRYFRVSTGDESFIAMDAPPEKEDCRPFVAVAEAMAEMGLNVPAIKQRDLDAGFLLLSDFGDVQYLQRLNDDSAERLYGDALAALLRLQTHARPALELPHYDHALLWREMELFREWFLGKHLGVALDDKTGRMLDEAWESLAQSALGQPQVWVHRDYHSRNLMVTEDSNPGILDFQDAVVGAITYDLVSLLRDCYISWPRARVESWVEAYRTDLQGHGALGAVNQQTFLRWFDWMGVQRHLKAIGIFSRLNYRDGKRAYLGDIPRTLGYVLTVCEDYPELRSFHEFLQQEVLPRLDMESGQAR